MPTLKYRDPADGQFKPLIGGSSGGEAGGTATTIDGLPLGAILPYPSATPPTDWLLCDGAAIPAQYTDLIALIGANTPNLLGKFVAGAGGAYALNATGGADTVALTAAEMPYHGHGGATANDSPDHAHGYEVGHNEALPPSWDFTYSVAPAQVLSRSGVLTSHGANARHAHAVTAEGGGGAHENRPPFYALAYIIKAKLVDAAVSPDGITSTGGVWTGPLNFGGGWANLPDIPVPIPATGATWKPTAMVHEMHTGRFFVVSSLGHFADKVSFRVYDASNPAAADQGTSLTVYWNAVRM